MPSTQLLVGAGAGFRLRRPAAVREALRHAEPVASLQINGTPMAGVELLNGEGTLALPAPIPSLRPLLRVHQR